MELLPGATGFCCSRGKPVPAQAQKEQWMEFKISYSLLNEVYYLFRMRWGVGGGGSEGLEGVKKAFCWVI